MAANKTATTVTEIEFPASWPVLRVCAYINEHDALWDTCCGLGDLRRWRDPCGAYHVTITGADHIPHAGHDFFGYTGAMREAIAKSATLTSPLGEPGR